MKGIIFVVLLAVAAQAVKPKEAFLNLIPGAPAPVRGGSKIVNGEVATRGQFPHQAAVLMDGSSFCGGSLISTEWVLTAGHCGDGVSRFTITLGQQSRSDSTEEGKIVIQATEKIVHEGYNSFFLSNDVALVKLPSPVDLSMYIQLVTLPSRSDVGNTFEGDDVTVSGWGKTSDSSSGAADQLSFVHLNVMSNSECANYYGSSFITSSILCCAAPDGKSTCNGDSGGPLIIRDSNPPKQIAVVSFVSSAGCASGNPSGYARLTSHLDWIESNTGITIN